MKTVGEILSIARNSKNLSISDISIELKISKSIIIDFENDDIKNNSDIIFNIGHLRSYSNFLELDTDIIIEKFKDEVSFNNKKEKKNITPIVETNFFKIEKLFSASLILIILTSFYFLFIDQKNNDSNYALVPDIPESLEPIVEKANTFGNNLSTSSDINKSDFINNSSAIASIEFDEDVTTVATLKMLNPTWLQLRDQSNNIVLSKLMDKDEEFSYDLNLNYNITAGNAGNILVLIDGDIRGKIGKFGDILDSFVLYKDFTN
tara:strand:- start:10 stop:798 length:789 start_codon:yes stop_codon:yes gene_type:complete